MKIDCRKCKNLNSNKGGCIFGKNAKEAVEKCASHNFSFYSPVKTVKK